MIKFPIFPTQSKRCSEDLAVSFEKHHSSRPLHPHYMSEYTVLGLYVDQLDEAAEILEGAGVRIEREPFGIEALIDGPEHIVGICRILSDHGIQSEIADVIHGIYQG